MSGMSRRCQGWENMREINKKQQLASSTVSDL